MASFPVSKKKGILVLPWGCQWSRSLLVFLRGWNQGTATSFAAKLLGVVPADCSVQLVCGKPGCGKNLQRFPRPQLVFTNASERVQKCVKGLAVVDATVEEEEAMEVEFSCSPFYCGWLPELIEIWFRVNLGAYAKEDFEVFHDADSVFLGERERERERKKRRTY